MERWNTRRSKRIPLQIRVRVYGHRREKGFFREDTETLNVSANGTLLSLAAPVELGQTVVLMNRTTGEEQECRVAYVNPAGNGKARIALAFRQSAPHFWQVDFPPLQSLNGRLAPMRARAGSRR